MSDQVPGPLVLDAAALPAPTALAVLDRALVAKPAVHVLEVTGPGALSCLQGLLTCDVEKPGEGSYLWGAVLTPKGMILCDLWIQREAGSATLIVPDQGRAALLDVFQRSLPPRLARIESRDDVAVLRIAGPAAPSVLTRAGIAAPEPGRVLRAIAGDTALTIARPPGFGPFTAELLVPAAQASGMMDRLGAAGASVDQPAGLELARVLAGWPELGCEISDKTLPQEVRFDELGGVSYTKGCYTGQETVARVHFRGHPNRVLRGLIWDGTPDPAAPNVLQDDQPRGRIGTLVWLEPVERWIGLAVLRREVDAERPVLAAGAEATVVDLPFRIDA